MHLIKKIQRFFKKPWTDALSAQVTFYPSKIIVQTYDSTDGPWSMTNKITILPTDVSLSILGQTLKKHLAMTEYNPSLLKNDNVWEEYKKAAGFKTNKVTYKDARCILCYQKNNVIVLTPTENKYNTGYYNRPDFAINLPHTISDEELGLQLLNARELSKG